MHHYIVRFQVDYLECETLRVCSASKEQAICQAQAMLADRRYKLCELVDAYKVSNV